MVSISKRAELEKKIADAELVPLLVADVFHLAGAFRKLGNTIASRVGQTQATWQVLSVISAEPRTVAQIARRLGFARQSVQRTADQLTRAGLARYQPNPDHQTSPLLEIAGAGAAALARIGAAADKSHVKLAAAVAPGELRVAVRVLRQLVAALEAGGAAAPPR